MSQNDGYQEFYDLLTILFFYAVKRNSYEFRPPPDAIDFGNYRADRPSKTHKQSHTYPIKCKISGIPTTENLSYQCSAQIQIQVQIYMKTGSKHAARSLGGPEITNGTIYFNPNNRNFAVKFKDIYCQLGSSSLNSYTANVSITLNREQKAYNEDTWVKFLLPSHVKSTSHCILSLSGMELNNSGVTQPRTFMVNGYSNCQAYGLISVHCQQPSGLDNDIPVGERALNKMDRDEHQSYPNVTLHFDLGSLSDVIVQRELYCFICEDVVYRSERLLLDHFTEHHVHLEAKKVTSADPTHITINIRPAKGFDREVFNVQQLVDDFYFHNPDFARVDIPPSKRQEKNHPSLKNSSAINLIPAVPSTPVRRWYKTHDKLSLNQWINSIKADRDIDLYYEIENDADNQINTTPTTRNHHYLDDEEDVQTMLIEVL